MTDNRRLTVIMMADVVDYSRLMEADETGTLARLKERRTAIVEPTVQAQGGRVVKLMGDGMLMEFASAVRAVAGAVELQQKFTAANAALAPDRQIALRIGINLGDVIGEESDIYGHGVNVAARLEAQAPRSGILVSDAVHAQVNGKVNASFTFAGELQLKNIAAPVRAWRWTELETAATPTRSSPRADAAPSPAKPSITILPFTNLSGDPNQEFFAAGIGLDLESALSLIGGIELRAQGAPSDFQLNGSVRAASGQIRVTARLIEAAGGRQLWAGRYDGRADDIFALQEEITRQVAVAMQVKLTSGDYARLWDGQTRSLGAWERCVVASALHERWSEADNRRARHLLQEALEIDPDYAAAKVLLVKTWWYDARYYMQGDDREHALATAERLAKEVLERRPDTATAIMFLGAVAWLRERHDEAITLCRRATSLSPSDAWTVGFFGVMSIYSGDLHEGLVALERAARADPGVDEFRNDDAGFHGSPQGPGARPSCTGGVFVESGFDVDRRVVRHEHPDLEHVRVRDRDAAVGPVLRRVVVEALARLVREAVQHDRAAGLAAALARARHVVRARIRDLHRQEVVAARVAAHQPVAPFGGAEVAFAFLVADRIEAERDAVGAQHLRAAHQVQAPLGLAHQHPVSRRQRIDAVATAIPRIRAGQLKGLGITADVRSPLLPNVPTFKEAGLPQMVAYSWYGLMVPAATPPAVVEQLNRAVNEVLKLPEVQAQLDANGATAPLLSPRQFGELIAEHTRTWERVVRPLNLQLD